MTHTTLHSVHPPSHRTTRWSLSLLLVAALSACGGGSSGSTEGPAGPTATRLASCGQKEGPLKIMPMGDSITEGEAGHNSYRRALWQRLQGAGCNVDLVGSKSGVSRGFRDSGSTTPLNPDFDQNHEGYWSYRADEILSFATNRVASAQPDVVLLHAGTNDILQGQGAESTAAELSSLIDAIRAGKSDVRIVLAKLIPASPNPGGIAALNQLIDGIASQQNKAGASVVVVDQSSGFSVGNTYDGIHPSATGEVLMGNKWAEAILAWRSN